MSVNIKNGEKEFTNHVDTTPGEGRICKDGIYYRLDPSTHKASVTNKNDSHKFYFGDVIIPNTIEIDGEVYEVIEISEMAFCGCRNLNSVAIPKDVVTIGQSAFAQSSIKSVTFETDSKLETIGAAAFWDCENFEEMTLPENLVSIDPGAFLYCSKLKYVNIPKSVQNIGYMAFDLRYILRNISVNWDVPIDAQDAFVWGDMEVALQVPSGTSDLYKKLECWSRFNIAEGYWSEKVKK